MIGNWERGGLSGVKMEWRVWGSGGREGPMQIWAPRPT